MKRIFLGGGILGLLLVAFVFYRLRTMRPIEPRLSALSPTEQKRRRADAEKLVQDVEGVADSVKRRERAAWTVTATSEQLNTLLQDRITIKDAPIKDVGIALQAGQLSLNGNTKYKGFEVPIEMSGSIETPNGKLQFLVQSLTLGGFPIGGNWKAQAQKAITKALTAALGKADARFDNVVIEPDKLTVQGHNS